MKAGLLLSLCALFAGTSAAPQTLLASQFRARVLAAHNAERAALGLPLLVWDNDLGSGAATYAQTMAATGIYQHSNRADRPGVSENLWSGPHGAYSLEFMVAGWTSEKRMFAAGIFPNVSRTGNWKDVAHYTQMIWPATQRVGCALASTRRVDYLVCRYSPKGNIDGKPVGGTGYVAPEQGERG